MRARKEQVIDTLSGGLAQLAKRRKVRVINARGIFVDSQTLQLEGGDKATYDSERLTFDHCILATGSVPAMPKMFKIDSPRVMDSTGALALEDVPEIAARRSAAATSAWKWAPCTPSSARR